jgi:hypothetical protein
MVLQSLDLYLKLYAAFPKRVDLGLAFVFETLPLVELAPEVGICALKVVVEVPQLGVSRVCTVQLESGAFELGGGGFEGGTQGGEVFEQTSVFLLGFR